jgi:hypothetical protein
MKAVLCVYLQLGLVAFVRNVSASKTHFFSEAIVLTQEKAPVPAAARVFWTQHSESRNQWSFH